MSALEKIKLCVEYFKEYDEWFPFFYYGNESEDSITMGDLRELSSLSTFKERCLKAIAELEKKWLDENKLEARLMGKIDGLKLALSYFDEMKGEK